VGGALAHQSGMHCPSAPAATMTGPRPRCGEQLPATHGAPTCKDFVPQHNDASHARDDEQLKRKQTKKKTYTMHVRRCVLHEFVRCMCSSINGQARSCHACWSLNKLSIPEPASRGEFDFFLLLLAAQKHGAADQKQSKNIHSDSKSKAKTWAWRANTSKHNPANVFANEEAWDTHMHLSTQK